jgi:hypothetical protein
MAMDIDGSIFVCGDYKGDLKQIANALGRLTSDYPGHQSAFEVDRDKNRIVWNGDCCGGTSVYPKRHVLMLSDGHRIYADEADELAFKQWETDDGDWDCEKCDLETVSRLVSPLLTSGTIELVLFENREYFSILYERLVVRCDGSVEIHSDWSRVECGTDCISERYDPTAKRDAA